jgi:hypothetical protein
MTMGDGHGEFVLVEKVYPNAPLIYFGTTSVMASFSWNYYYGGVWAVE